MDSLMLVMETLRDFRCTTETYLVIDNYHLMHSDIPRELLYIFSMHGSSNLHMIFITQQLRVGQKFTVYNDNIHTINSSSFFIDKKGIDHLFRMEGVHLSAQELDHIFTSTEGWAYAIRLQIINYKENGSFDQVVDIEHLVESAIWNRLSPLEKDFLLSISVMDSFTARQATIMLNGDILPRNIEELLRHNDFIRFFPDKGVYAIHSILLDYLRNRFYHYQPLEYQRQVLCLAAQSYVAISQFYPAAQLFYKVRDFDSLLSLPFDGAYLGDQREKNLMEFVAAVVEECPEETLCKYPYVMLMFAYPAMLSGQSETYRKLIRLIGSVVENIGNLGADEHRRIKGEFVFLQSYTAYNDIRKMSEGRKAAWVILGEPSSVLIGDIPYTFGGISVLNMFWREIGELDDDLRFMDECLPHYRKLARGHGSGANSIMRAEAMLMRGEDDDAEMLSHRASYAARSHQQISICMCAELVLARVAILRGDVEGYFIAVKNMEDYAQKNTSIYVLRMLDLCIAVLSLTLSLPGKVAPWLCDLESIRKTLYVPVIPYAQMLYSNRLLLEKKYNELNGLSLLIADTSKSMHCQLPMLYHQIHLAVAKRNSGKHGEARELLGHALAMALPDRLYLPFAQQEGLADALPEVFRSRLIQDKEFSLSGSTASLLGETSTARHFESSDLQALMSLCKRQEKGASIIRKALQPVKSSLTPREREVALLARDRLSSKEIAGKLFISEATVKTILKNTYNKLSIHSKSELALIEL